MKTPLFKYTGSKRHLATKIISHFPESIHTYYEPFLGGGSVFFELLRSNKKVEKYRLSDINEPLIKLFELVKNTPEVLSDSYTTHWELFQKDKDYYYSVRKEFNQTKNPLLFHFLMRTAYNGTIRYNSKGEFNTSCHFGRPGMDPDSMSRIIFYYHHLMADKDIEFSCMDYTKILSLPEDAVYLDPPYTNTTSSKSLYAAQGLDLPKFKSWLHTLPHYYLNLNNVSDSDKEASLESDLYRERHLLASGKSGFSKLKGLSVNVSEYFYVK